MRIQYNNLFKMLIDRKMKKNELAKLAGVSFSSIAKMGREENVTIDILAKICCALDCKLDDIVEIIPDKIEEEE